MLTMAGRRVYPWILTLVAAGLICLGAHWSTIGPREFLTPQETGVTAGKKTHSEVAIDAGDIPTDQYSLHFRVSVTNIRREQRLTAIPFRVRFSAQGTVYSMANENAARPQGAPDPTGAWCCRTGKSSIRSTATKAVLLAYMRSGSSLTGDVVQQSPDVFYMFEPLFSVKKQLSHYFDINNKRFSSVKRYQHILESILTCNLTSLDYSSLTQHHLTNSLSTRDYFNCTRYVESISDLHECLRPVLSTCAESRVVFTKVIRAQMIGMHHLLSKYPEFKVIHLLRDPRGLLSSQLKVGHLPDGIAASAMATCDEIYTDVERSIGLKRRFPGRVLTVRYEDIALYPLPMFKLVYDFLGIELTKNIRNYILDMTSNSVTKCGARCIRKNSSFTVFKWQKFLPYPTVMTIDSSCSKLYLKAGYLPQVSDSFGPTLSDMPQALTEL